MGDYYATAGMELDEGELAAYADDGWMLKVTGLPVGLSYDSKTGAISGAPTKIGNYTVTFTATKSGEKTQVATRLIVVEGRTVELYDVGDEDGMKSLTGDGTYAVGEKVSLKAVANTGYVFAGWYSWYDGADNAQVCPFDGIDYRTAAITYTMPDDYMVLYARFVSAADDALSLTTGMDDQAFEVVCEDWECSISVKSISAPTLKVTGLPKELSYDAKEGKISGKPTSPGVYTVTLTLANASVKSKIETFKITVLNVSGEAIQPSWGERDNCYLLAGRSLEEYELWVGVDDGWALKVAGLPSGLTYNSQTDEITGKPTKTGTYTVTFTATKSGEEQQVSTRTIVVDPVIMELQAVGEVEGMKSLTGDGEYAVGTKVSLRAVANKGYVFAGWYGIRN